MLKDPVNPLRNDESRVTIEARTAPGGEAATVEPGVTSRDGPPNEALDLVFGIRQNERKRYMQRYSDDVDESLRMSDIVEQLAIWACEKEDRELSAQDQKRVYIDLYLSHILADGSAISYTKARVTIPEGNKIDLYMDCQYTEHPRKERPPGRYTPIEIFESTIG